LSLLGIIAGLSDRAAKFSATLKVGGEEKDQEF